eukprot:TRINITY_DN20982_c0_g1_i4.p1 TRINITY_DN20982_c0_g1~~TRINITY_DN20982_c0_g1_i4.p1  ORF type:complete len:374 (+),score=78.81 TRINITY_DN20982_c0_g1_i4:53-1174(+)
MATSGSLRARRPAAVIEASRVKFAQQQDAGKEKKYGAVGELDYSLTAFVWNCQEGGTETEKRERVFGLSELMDTVKANVSPEDFQKLRVLDLGCGDGQSLLNLHDKYGLPWSQIAGVTAEDMRQVEVLDGRVPFDYKGKCGSEAENSYIVYNIDDLDNCDALKGKCFDVIVSWITWCWVGDPLGDLEMIYERFLAPGGIMLIGSMEFLTDAPDTDTDMRNLYAMVDVLQGQGHDIYTCQDAANGVYTWWLQRKPSCQRPMHFGEFVDYHPTEPVSESQSKAMYQPNDDVLLAIAQQFNDKPWPPQKRIPSTRVCVGADEALAALGNDEAAKEKLNKRLRYYMTLPELDFSGTVTKWMRADPCSPGSALNVVAK